MPLLSTPSQVFTWLNPALPTTLAGYGILDLALAPTVAGRGPLLIGMGTALDPVLVFGYNHQPNYTVAEAGEPGVAWILEADYDDGSGQHKVEGYLQHLFGDGSGSYNRSLMTIWNRVTNLPVETSVAGGVNGVGIYNNVGAGAPGSTQFVLGDLVAKFLPASTSVYSTQLKLAKAAAAIYVGDGTNSNSTLAIDFPDASSVIAVARLGLNTNTSASTKGLQIYKFDGTATLDAWIRPNNVSYVAANGAGTFGVGTTAAAAKLAINGGVHVGGDTDPGDDKLLVDSSITQGGALALGTTSTDGVILQNTTAATAGVPVQQSPRLRLRANVWNTTAVASHTDDWFVESVPASGATPSGLLKIGKSLNGGAVTFPLTLDSAGGLTVLGTISQSAGTLFRFLSSWNLGATGVTGQALMRNATLTAGVGLDVATDAVLKVRTTAHTGYATVDALGYSVSGVAGASKTAGPVTSITVVNGIVTACT